MATPSHKAVIVRWKAGHTTCLITDRMPKDHERIVSLEPLYAATGIYHAIDHQAAAEQLAFALHKCQLPELSTEEAKQVHHLAHVTVQAALKVKAS